MSDDRDFYRGDPPPPGSGTPPGYGPPPGAPAHGPAGYAPPGYAPPGYGPPGYGPTGPPPPFSYRRPTNTMAILALVFIFVFTPVSLVLGLVARRQIRQTGEEGDGMALAGVIVGGISVALLAVFILFFVFGAVAVSTGP